MDAAAPHARGRVRDRKSRSSLRAFPDRRRRPGDHWRQGRCLAYGDGITMWALGEIAEGAGRRPRAGLHRGDRAQDPSGGRGHARRQRRRRASRRTCSRSSDSPRRRSLAATGERGVRRLATLPRGALAEQRTLVLVVEDIHWADESLLDFLDELVDWVTDAAAVVATARPELLERRPLGGGKLNATTLALAPLSDEQTARPRPPAGQAAARGRVAEDAPRARRRKPALRGAVRRASSNRLERSAPASRDPPGHHRRAPRRPPGVGEGSPAGCRSRREGLLGKLDRPRHGGGQRIPSLTGAQASSAASGARHSRGRASSPSRTRSCATLPTDRSPAPTARRSTGRLPSGSRASAGRRTTRRCSPTTGALRTRARPCFG